MSAIIITLPIDTEIAGWLSQKAAAQGVNIEQVAIETLRRQARKPSINEVFADVKAEFEASGMTDLELDNAHFVISREQYEAFLAELDKPPKAIPALKKLFSEPGVLDEPAN